MIICDNVSKCFVGKNQETEVLKKLNLSVKKGEIFVVLGQSGCGKSTLLRLIGGFINPDAGDIFIDGEKVVKPSKNAIMMFQSFDQLFPWFSLKENIVYALNKTGAQRDKLICEKTALKYLEKAGLSGFENAYPHELSGGMKQRGALARALAIEPKVLLMDEPFSSLDYLTRISMRNHVKELQMQTGTTIVLVTHDIEEAAELGDTIAVLGKDGKQVEIIKNNRCDNIVDKLKNLLI